MRPTLGVIVLLMTVMTYAGAGTRWASAAEVTVVIENEQMVPRLMIVPQGTTVTWMNGDAGAHTVTSIDASGQRGHSLASPILAPGDRYSFTFVDPGAYRYRSDIIPWVEGEVQVEEHIPVRRGQRPPRLDRVSPVSGLSVVSLRAALLRPEELGPGFAVVGEDDFDPGTSIARDFGRHDDTSRPVGVRIGVTADAPLDPQGWVEQVELATRIEVETGVSVTSLPVPQALGPEARAAVMIVEADGRQLRTELVVWQHGPILGYVMLRVLSDTGAPTSTPVDRNAIAERQLERLSALFPQ